MWWRVLYYSVFLIVKMYLNNEIQIKHLMNRRALVVSLDT